jgi:hypothetical protein
MSDPKPDTPPPTTSRPTNLPRFVVLGQGKSGTSLLYRLLQKQPGIALSTPKELHYFSNRFAKGLDWYASHFPAPDGRLVGEVSPSYLHPAAVQNLADTLGRNTKVIFILRRPIEQAYSRYLQNICASQTGRPFHQRLRMLGKSLAQTEQAVAHCYDLFGADNVLPLFYERDVAPDPGLAERRILDFIGITAPGTYAQMAQSTVNPGVMPRYMSTGDDPLVIRCGGTMYRIPPQRLVFCAQSRNFQIWKKPGTDRIAAALQAQSRWSTEVTEKEYGVALKQAVLPAAERLQKRFGFDMGHWDISPQRIAYDPAPPPDRFARPPGFGQKGTKKGAAGT